MHWMKYSPGTSNVGPGYAGDLTAEGVHCCSSGWASKHILHFLLRHSLTDLVFWATKDYALMMSFVVWGV